MKCLTCEKEIPEDMKWCSIKCKEDFYKEEYVGSIMAKSLEVEYEQNKDKERIENNKKYNEWRKLNPGKGMTAYIQEYLKLGV